MELISNFSKLIRDLLIQLLLKPSMKIYQLVPMKDIYDHLRNTRKWVSVFHFGNLPQYRNLLKNHIRAVVLDSIVCEEAI